MKNYCRTKWFVCTALVLAVLSSFVFVSCETYDDSEIQEAVKDLEDRVSGLEKSVAETMSALQSMVSLGSIAKCEYDGEQGKLKITLLDGKTVTFDITIDGNPLVTVVEKDGEFWWGICNGGETTLLEIDGKNIPVSVTPALKLSDNNEWLISADGGVTWVSTGIYQNADSDSSGVVFFKDVVLEGEYLYLTLADGKEIKVAIVGEAVFSASESSLWFTRAGEEKSVVLTMKNVKAFTVTEKPEGWKVQVNEEMLVITSPSDISTAEHNGTVKVLSTFTNGANPEIVSIDVQYEPEIALHTDAYGTVKVNVSEHVGSSYSGYLVNAWKSSDFSLEAVVSWLNSEGYSSDPHIETAEFTVSELVNAYDKESSYVIFAVSYIPQKLVVSGEDVYELADVLTVTYTPTGTSVTVTDIRYDSAQVNANLSGLGEYYGGVCSTEDWNNFVRDNFLELLSYGEIKPLTAVSYNGPASSFPDGIDSINFMPSTEYTLWMIPLADNGIYKESDFIVKTFTTSGITSDSSISAPEYVVNEVTYGGFTAEVSPASGAYKTYASILPASLIPENETELVNILINANNCSEGNEKLEVTSNSFSSGAEVYLVAVSMSKDGGFGVITKELVELKEFGYTDQVAISGCEVDYGVGDVTLTLAFKGNPSTITYSVATFTYYTDDVLQKMLAMSQFGDVKDLPVTSLSNGNQIHLTGLEIGAEYTFYAIVKDSDGTPSYMFTKTFVPSITVDYVLSSDSDYTYGMPQLTGSWSSDTSYTLSVTKPDSCVKYWISVCDAEYLTGDVWSDTDKLISENLYNSEVYTESIEGKTFTYLHEASKVYLAWLDDKGKYHAIYEYDIQSDR